MISAAHALEFQTEKFLITLSGNAVVTSDAFSLAINKTEGTPAKEQPTAINWLTMPAFGDTYVRLNFKHEVFGFQFSIFAPDDFSRAPNSYHLFKDTFAWINFGKVAKVQAGLFEKTLLNKLNDIVDLWDYGYIERPGTKSGDIGATVKTDLLQNVLAEFYAGPVTIEFSPMLINSSSYQAYNAYTWFQPGAAEHDLKVANVVRVSAPVLDVVKLQMVGGINYGKAFARTRPSTSSRVDKNTVSFLGSLGGEIIAVPNFSLAMMYSTTFKAQWNSWEDPASDKTETIISDFYNAIDVRAFYGGIKNLSLTAHMNFSFGNWIEKSTTEKDGAKLFATKIALGLGYNINESFRVHLVVPFQYSDRTLRQERNVAWDFAIQPGIRWSFIKDCYVQAELKYSIRTGSSTDSTGLANPTTWDHSFSVPLKVSLLF